MHLPTPRGPVSESLFGYLGGSRASGPKPAPADAEILADEDLQLALYCAYELHYRGFDGIDPALEWDPALLTWRASLERSFELSLRASLPRWDDVSPSDVPSLLFELSADEGPPLSRQLAIAGTMGQFREFVVHRSAYQLKEADPHSWAIPRLYGAPKAALVEVQTDEYGGGRPERVHAKLFADSMRALDLDDRYGAYLELIPGRTLATVNLITLFGLHRRLCGATVGHLAMFEITSPGPNRRYANGLRRLGAEQATEFFDEHVEADSVHENVAAYDLAGGLAMQQPELACDILFGAEALLELERRWAERVLDDWERDGSSLLAPLGAHAPVAA